MTYFLAFDPSGEPALPCIGKSVEAVEMWLYEMYGSRMMTKARADGGAGYEIVEVTITRRDGKQASKLRRMK